MKIILGVSGSIAAYKTADLVNRLKDKHEITVIMTKSACEFISPMTLQTLSQNKVFVTTFDADEANVSHIDLALNADLILVAPATANIIAKAYSGIADDLLSTIMVVAGPEKITFAPAMNTHMFENKITQRNIEGLKEFGSSFIEPRESLLACNEFGKGALATVDTLVDYVNNYQSEKK